MAKNKQQKFKELLSFKNTIQPNKEDLLNNNFNLKGKWNSEFKNNSKIILELGCGKGEYSISLAKKNPNYNYLVAPHEINYSKKIASQLNGQLYSNYNEKLKNNVLVIDSIGILKNLYKYCTVAYVGGGFGNGIHNILEASYHNIPVIFGPQHNKFNEAKSLIKVNGAKSIKNYTEFLESVNSIKNWYNAQTTEAYFEQNLGASQKVIDYLKTNKL